tara:strand:+ start:1029 stop:1259 length:231 start_codon:yes stop_codon:yes gene_type:complete
MANKKEYFLDCLQMLKNNLSDENYKIVTGVIRAVKYGYDFDYLPGYDLDLENDIQHMRKTKYKNNVIKFKIISGDK